MVMKRGLGFFIKSLAVSLVLVLSQTSISDTGYSFIGNPLDEPIFLTICGIALLFIGFYKTNKETA